MDYYNWCLTKLEYLQYNVDPIVVANELSKSEYITKDELRFLFRLTERKDIWHRLFAIISNRCPFGDFLEAVERSGYSFRFQQRRIEGLYRADCQNPSRRFSQRLLVNLKMQTHNAVFGNPREFLHRLSCIYYKKFINEMDAHKKQVVADRYASVVCAEIDSHIMLYKESNITQKKLRKLKALIPHTTNACVTGVAYNARMAIASTVAGNFTLANDFIQMSKIDAFNLQACVEVENMLYIEVFNLLTQFEINPSTQVRDQILKVSDEALQLLEEEEELSRLFWRRMFLLRMTYCLFGLSMKFNRIPGCYIDLDAIQRGKRYLAEIDKCWEGIESRRKIWYYVARARQHELECHASSIATAIWYVDQAIELGDKGEFSEMGFAKEYKKGLLIQKEYLESKELDENRESSEMYFAKEYKSGLLIEKEHIESELGEKGICSEMDFAKEYNKELLIQNEHMEESEREKQHIASSSLNIETLESYLHLSRSIEEFSSVIRKPVGQMKNYIITNENVLKYSRSFDECPLTLPPSDDQFLSSLMKTSVHPIYDIRNSLSCEQTQCCDHDRTLDTHIINWTDFSSFIESPSRSKGIKSRKSIPNILQSDASISLLSCSELCPESMVTTFISNDKQNVVDAKDTDKICSNNHTGEEHSLSLESPAWISLSEDSLPDILRVPQLESTIPVESKLVSQQDGSADFPEFCELSWDSFDISGLGDSKAFCTFEFESSVLYLNEKYLRLIEFCDKNFSNKEPVEHSELK